MSSQNHVKTKLLSSAECDDSQTLLNYAIKLLTPIKLE